MNVARPILWGLSVGGKQGVADIWSILAREIDRGMALSGCDSVEKIDRRLLGPVGLSFSGSILRNLPVVASVLRGGDSTKFSGGVA
ncbi:MAG: alpha-hydroxy-acid oxidizing protein [Mariniblastus sp.]|nr:alpha-hydroxy-acid oxidizing protein [Mariniblastus sp.]